MIQEHGFRSWFATPIVLTLLIGVGAHLGVAHRVHAADDFVVFGMEGVQIKPDSVVVSGDVGGNLSPSGPLLHADVEVSLGPNVRMESAVSRVFGNRVALGDHTQIFDVQANSLSGNGTAHGHLITPIHVPVVTTLPPIPKIPTATEDVHVPPSSMRWLDAGSFDELMVRAGATLTLTGGVYTFSSIDVKTHARLVIEAATEIHVANRFAVGERVRIEPATGTALTGADLVIVVTGHNGSSGSMTDVPKATSIGTGSTIHANIYGPNGSLEIQANSEVHGALLGKWVIVGPKSSVSLEGGFGLKVREENQAIMASLEQSQTALGLDPGSAGTTDATSTPISASPASGLAPLTVSFHDQSPLRVSDYRWDFGDGHTSTDATPTHTFSNPGTYQIQLRVTQPDHHDTLIEGPTITVYPEDGIPLLFESFHDPSLPGWQVTDDGSWQGPSQWMADTGTLTQTSNIWSPPATADSLPQPGTYLLYHGGMKWQDYRATFIMSSTDDDAFGMMFRVQDEHHYYRFSWDRERAVRRVVKNVNGVFSVLAEDHVPYELGKAYQVEILAARDLLEVRIDSEPIMGGPIHDASLSVGSIAFYSWYNKGAHFDDLSVKGLEAGSTTNVSTIQKP